MKITNSPDSWHNILHLTTGESCCDSGTRIPGVWLNSRNGKPYLMASITMTHPTELTQDFTLEMNKQYYVELVLQENGFFSVTINGVEVWRVNSGAATFQNVKYYWSDPWSPSAGEAAILSKPNIRTQGSGKF